MRHLTKLGLFAAVFTVACVDGRQSPTSPADRISAATGSGLHFVASATDATVDPNPDLLVNFKEAGVGSGVTVYISASATFVSVWECINGGGKNPKADNKDSQATLVANPPSPYQATAGGNVVSSQTLIAPISSAPADLHCGGGQEARGTGYWTDVNVADVDQLTSAVRTDIDIAGTFPVAF